MESLAWHLRTLDRFTLVWPVVLSLALCLLITQSDFPLLLANWFARHALGNADPFVPRGPGERPSALVIIPALLRGDDDFEAIVTTVESCGHNGYPGELAIVASVDGRTERPDLYARLEAWIRTRDYGSNIRVYATGTETRLGKMMAVEAGVQHVERLVEEGRCASFPHLYFSIDGDGTLSENALERLAHRLETPHPLTGNKRRIVSGKICIRPDLFWRGWRSFFTVEGQLYIQVAREFVVSNVSRFNWKLTPMIGVPGALYCTYAHLLREAPRYMGFMQSIRFVDWFAWFFGAAPPKFSESKEPPLPEALTGASDDTCIAFLASIAHWKDGSLSWDAPRTPLHAFGRLIVSYFFERSHDYEPEARVYTYTPDTLKGLWRQRVRWNASRFECAGRFWRAFWFHWEIGFPVSSHLWLVLHTVVEVTTYYVLLPYYCLGNGHAAFGYVLGYAGQTFAHSLYTAMALVLERDLRRFWPVVFALPLASLYSVGINFFGCVYGVAQDLLFYGNWTNFAPEWTLKKSRCERIALMYRARRFLALSWRALVHGDVPFGSFWLGWHETQWTPSGFEGWTTGKRPRAVVIRVASAPETIVAPPPSEAISRPEIVEAVAEQPSPSPPALEPATSGVFLASKAAPRQGGEVIELRVRRVRARR